MTASMVFFGFTVVCMWIFDFSGIASHGDCLLGVGGWIQISFLATFVGSAYDR